MLKQFDVAVIVGTFHFPAKIHQKLLSTVLSFAERQIVVVTETSPVADNPESLFTSKERIEMLDGMLTPSESDLVYFEKVSPESGEEDTGLKIVEKVIPLLDEEDSVAHVGFNNDDTGFFKHKLEKDWTFIDAGHNSMPRVATLSRLYLDELSRPNPSLECPSLFLRRYLHPAVLEFIFKREDTL